MKIVRKSIGLRSRVCTGLIAKLVSLRTVLTTRKKRKMKYIWSMSPGLMRKSSRRCSRCWRSTPNTRKGRTTNNWWLKGSISSSF